MWAGMRDWMGLKTCSSSFSLSPLPPLPLPPPPPPLSLRGQSWLNRSSGVSSIERLSFFFFLRPGRERKRKKGEERPILFFFFFPPLALNAHSTYAESERCSSAALWDTLQGALRFEAIFLVSLVSRLCTSMCPLN